MMRGIAFAIRQLQIVIPGSPIRTDIESERHRPTATVAIGMRRRLVMPHRNVLDPPHNLAGATDAGDFKRAGSSRRGSMQIDRFAGISTERIRIAGKHHFATKAQK
jgi:hypothetical protein